MKESILTQTEFKFYEVLKAVVGSRFVILTTVRLADIFFTQNGKGFYGAFNKIKAKHVDFLLCDPSDLKPVLGIELDDKSHSREDRKERDLFVFVNELFSKKELPLLRIKVKRNYEP